MLLEDRHKEILNLLSKKGRIKAREIEEQFDVGFDTARRDLRLLEEKGLLKRIHGGALPIHQVGFTVANKYTPRDIVDIKSNYLSIAMKAVGMINENDVVYITGASVGYFMVQNLPVDIEFTVATNSIIIADELRRYENISTYLLGGLMTSKGQLRDHHTLKMIKDMRFDIIFLTGAAFSIDFGMSIQYSSEIPVYQALIESTRKCVGLFPYEKVGRESILKICGASDFDVIITDWKTCEGEINKIKDLGVAVVVTKESVK